MAMRSPKGRKQNLPSEAAGASLPVLIEQAIRQPGVQDVIDVYEAWFKLQPSYQQYQALQEARPVVTVSASSEAPATRNIPN